MTLPDGHPPFAKPAAGIPVDALPFGRRMCDHLAATLISAGPMARDAIIELAMRPMDMHCQKHSVDLGDDVEVRIFRTIVGPAPLSLRFSAHTYLRRGNIHVASYADGTLNLRCEVPDSVVGTLVGRHVHDVIALPVGFPAACARIVRAHGNGYGKLVLGVEHRKTSITYADLAGPVPIAA